MSGYVIYELRCPSCHLQFAQMIPDKESHLPVVCPSCGDNLEKIRKTTGSELLASCGYTFEGG